MNDSDRILGRLEEFKEHTADRLEAIENKIDALQEFKWRIVGGAAVLSVISSSLVAAAFQFVRVLKS